jgi:hypothetical protein
LTSRFSEDPAIIQEVLLKLEYWRIYVLKYCPEENECAGYVYGDGPHTEVTRKCSTCNGSRLWNSGNTVNGKVPRLRPDSEASMPYDSQSCCPKPWKQVCCGMHTHIFLFDTITYAESVWLTMRSLDGIPIPFAINAASL